VPQRSLGLFQIAHEISLGRHLGFRSAEVGAPVFSGRAGVRSTGALLLAVMR
jgi:hypothetical protein